MTSAKKLTALGVFPAEAAACSGGDVQFSLATGPTSNMPQVTADVACYATSAGPNNNVQLANQGSAFQMVFNSSGVNALNVYPPTNGQINFAGVGVPFSIAVGKSTTFVCDQTGLTWIAQHAG